MPKSEEDKAERAKKAEELRKGREHLKKLRQIKKDKGIDFKEKQKQRQATIDAEKERLGIKSRKKAQ